MSTLLFRADYAKFLIDCHPNEWQSYYHALNAASHERKYAGEWLKSHKVNRLWYNAAADMETWSIDIWGEWAGIVEALPAHWFPKLRRLDIRAVVWDADAETIKRIGQHLCGNVTSHNINLYNTRPGTKRLGRDRGGVGFAIGSHKSDLRITCYKRTGEPVAQEFQMTGAYLRRLKEDTIVSCGQNPEVVDLWRALRQAVQHAGQQRLERVFLSAGLNTFWPVVGPEPVPDLPPIQAGFLVELPDEEEYPDEHDVTRPA